MTRLFLGAAVLSACFASSLAAQPVRTFVSTTGVDNAECSRVNPCRTFGAAILVVVAGGEVVPLDSGGYGPFVVTRSVSVVVPAGIHAAVAPTSGTAVSVQAGSDGVVTLRGLYFNNQGTSAAGIDFVTGDVLYVDRCEINGFPNGLHAQRGGTDTNLPVRMYVSDSTIQDGGNGIILRQGSPGNALHVVLDNCRLVNNTSTGLYARDGTEVSAREVIAAGNFIGFYLAPIFGETDGTLDHCVASGNSSSGVETTSGATVRMTRCTITDNGVGVKLTNPGVSLGDNLIDGNGTEVTGTLTIIPGN